MHHPTPVGSSLCGDCEDIAAKARKRRQDEKRRKRVEAMPVAAEGERGATCAGTTIWSSPADARWGGPARSRPRRLQAPECGRPEALQQQLPRARTTWAKFVPGRVTVGRKGITPRPALGGSHPGFPRVRQTQGGIHGQNNATKSRGSSCPGGAFSRRRLWTSKQESRPILQRIRFRPAADTGGTEGKPKAIATDAHKLVEMTGGRWEGEWPSSIPPRRGGATEPRCASCSSTRTRASSRKKANGLIGTAITVTLYDDGEIETIDPSADHRFESEGRKCLGPYPPIDRIFSKYERFVMSRDTTMVDAKYLENASRLGAIFSSITTRPAGLMLRRRKPKGVEGWHPVLFMDAECDGRTLRAVTMGTRDLRP